MRRWAWLIVVGVQAALVVGVLALIRSGRMPLGVKGEWEWLRVAVRPEPILLLIAVMAVGVYAAYAAIAMRRIARDKRGRAGWWLAGLVPMAVLVQAALQEGAPVGYGLAKWAFALTRSGSSGYYTVVKAEAADLPAFLAAYPGWIKGQGTLHVGTHPPGLFVTSWLALRAMEANPGLARWVVGLLPRSVALGFGSVFGGKTLPTADRAALAATGFAILCACAVTVVPVYWLARSRLSAPASWASACLWPLVPAAILFQPTADTAFPLLSTTALALACWSCRRPWLAVVAGVVLAVGTEFTLAFFPVGLVAGVAMVAEPGASWGRRAGLVARTGIGFVAATIGFWLAMRASPFPIWWSNSANHARFYFEYPRSYRAWVVANPIELAVALGVPTSVWLAAGLRSAPRVAWATVATLVLLTVTGRNLSEVARLWLPLMPPLVVAAGKGSESLGAGPAGLSATLVLLAAQVLVLEATIQVVYPI